MTLTSQHFGTSYPLLAVFSAVLGTLAFSKFPNWTDLFVAILLYIGMSLLHPFFNLTNKVIHRHVPREHRCFFSSSSNPHFAVNKVIPQNNSIESGIQKDILFPDVESLVYAGSDVVWRMDQQLGAYFRWWALRSLLESALIRDLSQLFTWRLIAWL